LGKRFASIFSGFFSLEVLICIPIKYGAESFSRLLNAHLYFQLLDRASHDGSEQSISVKFSSRTMGVRFPQADRQLDVKIDETTSSECVPTKIAVSKATSFLCVCVFTYEGGLVQNLRKFDCRIALRSIEPEGVHRARNNTQVLRFLFRHTWESNGVFVGQQVLCVYAWSCVPSFPGLAVKLFSGAMQTRQARHAENAGIIHNSGHEMQVTCINSE